MNLERRVAIELRATKDRKLVGYAARFNTEARIADFIEVIAPGAFAATLKSGRDIIGMVDHDQSKVLARTRSGNLKLSEDSTGLAFEIAVPDTSVGKDVLELALRNDLGGASIGFLPAKDGEQWNGNRRTLTAIDLREISIVSAWPAYPSTTVTARSKTPRLALAKLYLDTCRWA